MGFIYKLQSPSGKIYIGQTKGQPQKRWQQHCWPSTYDTAIHRAIIKYGFETFEASVVVEAPDEDLNDLEEHYIAHFDSLKKGYNSTPGGDVNPMDNPESRAKVLKFWNDPINQAYQSERMKLVMTDPEVRLRISDSLSETLKQPKHKAQRSAAAKKAWKNPGDRAAKAKEGLHKPDARKRHLDALERIRKDPDVQKRRAEAIKAACARRKAKSSS